MTECKIKNKAVPCEERQGLSRLLERIDKFAASRITGDGDITDDEMSRILDLDGDGVTNFLDLTSMDEQTFKWLKAELKRYEFSAYSGIFKNDYLSRVAGNKLDRLPQHMWKDLDFCVTAILGDVKNYYRIDRSFLEDNPVLTTIAARKMADILKDAPASHKDNETVVMEAVRKSGYAIKHASERLKKKDSVVLTAIAQDAGAIAHCDISYRLEVSKALKAVTANGTALAHLDDKLRSNTDIVRAAVAQNGLALQSALGGLNDDRAIVLMAIRQNGAALEFASNRLKEDQDICAIAVRQNGKAIEYAALKYGSLRSFVFSAVKTYPSAIHKIPRDELTKEDVMRAMDINPDVFRLARSDITSGRDVTLKAVTLDGMNLQYAKAYSDDDEVVIAAVRQNGAALEYASERLKKREDIALLAIGEYAGAISHVHDELLKKTDFRLKAIRANPGIFAVPKVFGWMGDDKFALMAANAHPWAVGNIENETLKAAVWNKILSLERSKLKPYFSDEELTSYAALKQALKDRYDIDHPEMFRTVDTIAEVIKNRKGVGDPNDKRPVCVILMAKSRAGEFTLYPYVD